ncbi:NAD(P)-dependent oxidoreductase [Rhodoferax lacus]|uniref:NAD(P)-dependent oxidoreductase n=1 Tax=Rhodoferax lacus TaxID=2184758 RepID=A0A3E1REL1_9BURK|nr:NAD(P)-dependent oxidoreductase [Rhodoferax lacus]RFO97472.1 NAD(P)-dependent oxidoreductase [Rhodoferax lacus]
MTHTRETVGFIGLGLMGHGMAKNLVDKGYALSIYARTASAATADLQQRGAVLCASAAELAAQASVVFLCVTGSRDVETLIRGPQGLKAGLQPGSVVVDCSTSDPTSTTALAAELAAVGVHLVDAPLSRTPKEAWAGTLDTMVGADLAVFKRIEPLLQTWAGRIVHVGATGTGHRMKLINNFVSLGYAALYAEALTLAQAVGITPAMFDAVIRNGRMDNLFYQTFMEYTLNGNREAHKFTLTNAFKDLRYLESMADDAGVSNPLGNAVKNSFGMAVKQGGPDTMVPMLPELVAGLSAVVLAPGTRPVE